VYCALGFVLLLGTTTAFVPGIRWRTQLVLLTVSGRIPDLDLSDLLAFLSPSFNQSLERVLETRNPYAVIRNPKTSRADVMAGAAFFRTNCANCHGTDATGGVGPALVGRELRHGSSDWAIFRTARYGVPDTAMEASALSRTDLWQVIAFIRSLDTPDGIGTKQPSIFNTSYRPVKYEELQSTREPSNDWLTYSGSYSSTRHSALTQIDPMNVEQLVARWIYQFPGPPTAIETTPVVRGGIMFVTLPPNNVIALEAESGRVLWHHAHARPKDATVAFNRGVALLDDKVYLGTNDAHLVALSATTGSVVWDVPVTNYKEGYYISSAPLAYRDLIVTGVATKTGGRAFIAAYDAKTGVERWRFFSIPGPGEPGNASWAGNTWRNGGAPTWLTGSYDPELDLLYWTVGNPKPDFDAAVRKGDNLYSNSVLALRGSTGKLVWFFQFTPGDDHDWDANQMPVLVDHRTENRKERLLLFANKNGFYYILDRESGRFISAEPFAKQTWTDGLDAHGRPIPRVQAPAHKGVVIYPGFATNWWPPSFDPELEMIFLPTLEHGRIFFPNGSPDSGQPSANNYALDGIPFYTTVRALDAFTGKLAWERRNETRLEDPDIGGLLSTRSGLVFGSDQSTFFALAGSTGELLWQFPTGGKIVAAPVTYMSKEEQFVSITSGNVLLTFALRPKPSLNVLPNRAH
jgi:alcohol dehydrogenase (cytochrome c)